MSGNPKELPLAQINADVAQNMRLIQGVNATGNQADAQRRTDLLECVNRGHLVWPRWICFEACAPIQAKSGWIASHASKAGQACDNLPNETSTPFACKARLSQSSVPRLPAV
jgi:hypothetical protein